MNKFFHKINVRFNKIVVSRVVVLGLGVWLLVGGIINPKWFLNHLDNNY